MFPKPRASVPVGWAQVWTGLYVCRTSNQVRPKCNYNESPVQTPFVSLPCSGRNNMRKYWKLDFLGSSPTMSILERKGVWELVPLRNWDEIFLVMRIYANPVISFRECQQDLIMDYYFLPIFLPKGLDSSVGNWEEALRKLGSRESRKAGKDFGFSFLSSSYLGIFPHIRISLRAKRCLWNDPTFWHWVLESMGWNGLQWDIQWEQSRWRIFPSRQFRWFGTFTIRPHRW